MRRKVVFFIVFYSISTLLYSQEFAIDIENLSLDSLLNIQISSASKYEQTSQEAAASVSIITSEDIEQYGYKTLEEVLNSIRGFYISNDRNFSYLGARGFSRPTDYNNRILVLIDGHSINENVYGASFFDMAPGVNIKNVERIEIVRGPGSAVYGSNAMFAVINIVSRKANDIDGIEAEVFYGSYSDKNIAFNFGKEFHSGVEFSVSGFNRNSAGADLYFPEFDNEDYNGFAKGLDWEKSYGYYTTLKYKNFSFYSLISARRKGIPTAPYEVTFDNSKTMTRDDRSFFELRYEQNISANQSIFIRAYYDYYYYFGYYAYLPWDYDWEENSTGNWFGTEIKYVIDLSAANRLVTGIEYKNNQTSNYKSWGDDEVYFKYNAPFDESAIYLHDEHQVLNNLFLSAGLRLDKNSRSASTVSPRFALNYNISQVSVVKLLYGKAFRSPTFYEIYYEADDSKANPGIKSEKIETFEVLYESKLTDNLYGVASFFNNRINGLIDPVIDEQDSLLQFKNVGEAKAYGAEFGLDARFENNLKGYLNLSIINTKDGNNKDLTNSPKYLIKSGVSYPFYGFLYTGLEISYESGRKTVFDSKTKPFLLTNLNFTSSNKFTPFKISLRVKNVFNVNYSTPGGFEHLQDAIEQNGRVYLLGLEFKI